MSEVSELLVDATGGKHPAKSEERTLTSQELLKETAGIRDEASILSSQVADVQRRAMTLHRDVIDRVLNERTAVKGKNSVPELLDRLAARGFSWAGLARQVGVSIPALRKWRKGLSTALPEHRQSLAQFEAACELLEELMVDDVASWFEMPLQQGVPITCADIYRAGRVELVFDYATHRIADPRKVLREFEGNWRTKHADEFEVFEAPDGELAIRMTGDE